MSPPRGSSRRRSADPPGATRRRRKRRQQTRKHRSRRTMLIAALVVVPIVVLVAGAVGATAVFGSPCDLNALRPVAVGQNTFVYAANGSALAVIPAHRNRRPVSQSQISPWVPRATVAGE